MGNRKMGRDSGRLRQEIIDALIPSGTIAIGFCPTQNISDKEADRFSGWVAKGHNAGMVWLERHRQLRMHPRNVLPGAKSLISLAFSYVPPEWPENKNPRIATYACGEDYHIVLREKLAPAIEKLKNRFQGEWRICIDSAPVSERYWAIKSGIASPALNGTICVAGAGSICFLAEILTTTEFPEWSPWFSLIESHPISANDRNISEDDKVSGNTFTGCLQCGLCLEACPGKAILGDGTIDCRRCLSYLTIEHRGELTSNEIEIINKAGNPLFGCDRCLRVCPINKSLPPTTIIEFHPHEVSPRRSPLKRSKKFS